MSASAAAAVDHATQMMTDENEPTTRTINSAVAAAATAPAERMNEHDNDCWLDIWLRWCFMQNGIMNNVELASISNVCVEWRHIVQQQQIILTTMYDCDDDNHDCGPSSSRQQRSNPPHTLLLLPSMLLWLRQQQQQQRQRQQRQHSNGTNSSYSTHNQQNQKSQQFCAAWFPSEGIRPLSELRQRQRKQQQQHNHNNSHRNTNTTTTTADAIVMSDNAHPAGMVMPAADNDNVLEDRDDYVYYDTNSSSSSSDDDIWLQRSSTMAYEWEGYQTAIDVLRPFGYTESFVHSIMSSVAEGNGGDGTTKAPPHPSKEQGELVSSDGEEAAASAVVVRGAVVARPESYCLCMDDQQYDDEYEYDNDDQQDCREQRRRQRLRRRRKRRRLLELQKEVLPRIIRHNNLPAIQFLNAGAGGASASSHAVCMMTPPFLFSPMEEENPAITIFCVGIATEDGCFMSGLHQRFELGHLYPHNDIMEMTETSQICLATTSPTTTTADEERNNRNPRRTSNQENDDDDGNDNNNNMSVSTFDMMEEEEEDASSSSDGDYYYNEASAAANNGGGGRCNNGGDAGDYYHGGNGGRRNGGRPGGEGGGCCTCIFKGVTEKVVMMDDDDDDDEEDTPRNKYRGKLGPGRWHLYTAIFDGPEHSRIRVDGVEEPMSVELAGAGAAAETRQTPTAPANSSNQSWENHAAATRSTTTTTRRPAAAMLDGLTIGSDHCFGMSLCSGQHGGSGAPGSGQGEGAIAELAVFAGRLDLADIQVLERHLMAKHGLSPSSSSCGNDNDGPDEWTDDDLSRQAHALFYSEPVEQHVPLRYLTRHRFVAWKMTNPVTGEPVPIHRIGCRPGASSSDF